MKKLISILLVLVLALTMFAGCGNNIPTDADKQTSSATKKKKKKKKKQTIYVTKEPDASSDADDYEDYYEEDEDLSIEGTEDDDKVIEEIVNKLKIDTSVEHYVDSMYVNVKEHGAVGDGKTDDTEAIQKAINIASNQTVYFPAGTYLVTKPIQISSDVNMIGAALDKGVGGKTVIKAGADMDSVFSGWNNLSMRMYIANFTIDGSANEGKKVEWGMNLWSPRSTKVFNCRVTNITGGGINCASNGGGQLWVTWFVKLQFDNLGGYALRSLLSDSAFSHITVDGGLGIQAYNYGGNCYSNILVKNSKRNGLAIGSPDYIEGDVNKNANVTVRNCSFVNCAEYGLFAANYNNSSYSKQSTVSECFFEGNGKADIYTAYTSMLSVKDCVLKSDVGKDATNNGGSTFMNNTFKAANIKGFGGKSFSDGNTFNATSFDKTGYMADDTQFEFYEKAFNVIGGDEKLEYVRLEDCGSDVDGDWSQTFKVAVARVAKKGGVVYCEGSEYGIGDTVVIPSNVYIVGHGFIDRNQFFPKGTVDSMFVVRNAENSGFINCTVSNLSATNKATYGGIYFMRSKNCFFFNCQFGTDASGSMPYAVNIDGKSSNIQVDSSKIGGGSALYAPFLVRGSDCEFQNLYCTGGPSFILMDGSNNTLQSNHFETCETATHITIKGDNVKGHRITSNYFDVNMCCIRMSFQKSYNTGIEISSNTFRTDARVVDGVTGIAPPEIIISAGNGISILANTYQQGFSIMTIGIACTDSKFIGNIVGNSGNELFSANSKALGEGCTNYGNFVM